MISSFHDKMKHNSLSYTYLIYNIYMFAVHIFITSGDKSFMSINCASEGGKDMISSRSSKGLKPLQNENYAALQRPMRKYVLFRTYVYILYIYIYIYIYTLLYTLMEKFDISTVGPLRLAFWCYQECFECITVPKTISHRRPWLDR